MLGVWGVGGLGLVGWGCLPSPGLIILLDQRVGTTFYFCSFAGDQGKNKKEQFVVTLQAAHGRNARLAGRVGVGWRCLRLGCCR